MEPTKYTGTIKFFDADKRFGFIRHDNASDETFVHADVLSEPVQKGDRVEFEERRGKRGMSAVNVRLLK